MQQLAWLAGARGLDVPLVLLAEVGLVVVRRVRGEVRVVARRGRRDDLGAARVPSGSSHRKYRQSSKKGGAAYHVSYSHGRVRVRVRVRIRVRVRVRVRDRVRPWGVGK